jgi:hypothetical protein
MEEGKQWEIQGRSEEDHLWSFGVDWRSVILEISIISLS